MVKSTQGEAASEATAEAEPAPRPAARKAATRKASSSAAAKTEKTASPPEAAATKKAAATKAAASPAPPAKAAARTPSKAATTVKTDVPSPAPAPAAPPAAAAAPPARPGGFREAQAPFVAMRPHLTRPAPTKGDTNFKEGDHVVYPTHGVGKVERIATEEIAGHQLELIHITFEENRMTLRVPVSRARSTGLRKLSTRKQFDEALNTLKGRARIKRTMWSRRAQEYEAKINSGDPVAIAEVVRDLHRNAGQPDQSFSERQIYEAALDRLAAELAAIDQTDKPTALAKLGNFLKAVIDRTEKAEKAEKAA